MRGLGGLSGPPRRKMQMSMDRLLAAGRTLGGGRESRQLALAYCCRVGLLSAGAPGCKRNWATRKRRPICPTDVLARKGGKYVSWGNNPGEAPLRLPGSQTDWLNQGAARNRAKLKRVRQNPKFRLAPA